jgi:hypothetical protein
MNHMPGTCGVAFKEWDGVCEALARGRQSLILRKGGIDEGPGGFVPEHDAFWLYPTRVHQGQQGLKPEAVGWNHSNDGAPEGTIPLDALAVVGVIYRVNDLGRLAGLDDLHVWTAETVQSRFHYRQPGLWVLGVRIYHKPAPDFLVVTPEHAGCRTWVPLETPLPTPGLSQALDDPSFEETMRRLRSALGPASRG